MEKFIAKKFGMSLLRFHQAFGRKAKAAKPKAKNQIENLLNRAGALLR